MAKNEIFVMLGVVLVALFLFQQFNKPAAAPATPPSGGGVSPPVGNGACPDTLVTSFTGDAINSLNASGIDYDVQTFRLIPGGNFADFVTYATAASATRTSGSSLKCSHGYQLYPLVTIDAMNSVPVIDLGTVSGSATSRAVTVPELGLLGAKGYDNANRAAIYDTSDAITTDYDALALTLDGTTDNTTATTISTGGFIDWTVSVQDVSTVKQFGNSNMGTYIAFDADKASYDKPSVWINGVPLSDVKGTGEISANDEAVLSAYEYIFKVPVGVEFKTAPLDVRLYLAAKAGQDPSADAVLRFVGKGYYVGADGVTIKSDVFNEATNSEILTATVQTVTINLA